MIRRKRKLAYLKNIIESTINDSLNEKFNAILNDISYRLTVLQDNVSNTGVITSNKINLNTHILDGFVFTDNSPSAGYVAWTDCHVIYAGTTYDITSANTNKKYIWWKCGTAGEKIVFQTSDTKPALTDQDALICTNNAGIHNLVIGQGKMVSGAILLDASVKGAEIATDAITSTHVLNGAIVSGKLGNDAVSSVNIANDAVTSGKILSGSVLSSKLNIAQHLLS